MSYVNWRVESFVLGEDVIVPNNTLLGSFSTFDCRSFAIESKNCYFLSDFAFYESALIEFRATYLQEISYRCFFLCTLLETIDTPSVCHFGSSSHYACYNLTSVRFKEVSEIESYAFYRCTLLTALNGTFADTAEINQYAFCMCDSLHEIDMRKFASIGEKSFSCCSGLTEIRIQEPVIIYREVFSYCENIIHVVLGKRNATLHEVKCWIMQSC